MLFVILVVLLILTVAGLVFPLLRRKTTSAPARVDYDIVVYRSQLAEIEQDVERGLMSPHEAATARTEIHRRMLAAEDAESKIATSARPEGRRSRLIAAGVIGVVVIFGSLVMYGALGSPELAGKSSASAAWQKNDTGRALEKEADTFAAQIDKSTDPADFDKLGAMYARAHDFDKSIKVYHHAIDISGGKDSAAWAEMGEVIVLGSDGQIVPQALAAFIKALDIDPKDAQAQFYIGLAETQIGNLKKAVAIWRNLEKNAPPDAPWLPMVREHIQAFSEQGGFDPKSIKPAPPSVEYLRAALATMMSAQNEAARSGATMQSSPAPVTMPAAEAGAGAGGTPQDHMIRNMVARLAAKMEKNPNDADGWVKLARSYKVLGDTDKARDAINHAAELKPDDDGVKQLQEEIEKSAAPASE